MFLSLVPMILSRHDSVCFRLLASLMRRMGRREVMAKSSGLRLPPSVFQSAAYRFRFGGLFGEPLVVGFQLWHPQIPIGLREGGVRRGLIAELR